MTPKEKADELMDSMLGYGDEYHHCTQYVAKQCALIAVDEILNTLNYDIRDLDVRGSVLLDLIKYWQEVKQEIEKL
jgi:hypothetical protein